MEEIVVSVTAKERKRINEMEDIAMVRYFKSVIAAIIGKAVDRLRAVKIEAGPQGFSMYHFTVT